MTEPDIRPWLDVCVQKGRMSFQTPQQSRICHGNALEICHCWLADTVGPHLVARTHVPPAVPRFCLGGGSDFGAELAVEYQAEVDPVRDLAVSRLQGISRASHYQSIAVTANNFSQKEIAIFAVDFNNWE